ncbi:hypothetical protein Goklo_007496 [Gossypium klotzschianum]|uniref:DUF7745 domain-containing protein n=1 Tax=Gossypium klotzschianum TaxID=34286 RepID=A0A7J8W7I4_9ROSI|nr:hypothetical protein [Gossypium klotzschianum]
MGNGFLDRVEDNAAVRTWVEMTQREKGDSLAEGYWNNEARQLFYSNYGDLPYLLDMKVDKRLFQALAQFWNLTYSCFPFGKVDLVPTIEEYMALLRCSRIQVDIIYSKVVNVPTFSRKLMNITGMSEQWVTARIKQKGDSRCIPWKNLIDLILVHPDTKKKIDIFALSIYGMVVFPKALGHIDEAVTDLFDQLDKRVTPVPVILAETFRTPNACRRAGEGRFIGYAQLLLAWLYSHFWKVDNVSYRVFSKSYSLLKEIVTTPRRDDISEEKWMGAVGYAPLLVLRQYRSRQFVLATQGLAECEFSYKGDGYKKKVREMANAWSQTFRMKGLAVGPMTTPEYNEWWLEADKLRKGKNKAEEELDSLKTDYKKLRLSMRTTGLGKTSEQWREEIQEERKKVKLLEGSLRQHRSRNSVVELKASLSKIEEMKSKIEELEVTLLNCEVRIEHLKPKEGSQNEQLHYFQNQVKNRDHVMGEAAVQIRKVADHLQTLAVQADTLSVKYELESDRGQELASLLKRIKVLCIRAKPYL